MLSLLKWYLGYKSPCFHNQLLSLPGEKLQPRQPLLTSSPLIDLLPPELMLEIISWLPTSSAVSLSLCNHSLFCLLSRPYLIAIGANHTDTKERDLFLDLLSRDSIDLFFCSACRKLHRLVYDALSPPSAETRFAWTSNSRCKDWHEHYRKPIHVLTLEHLRVAANLYQHGFAAYALRYLQCAAVTQPQPNMLSISNWGFYFFESCFIKGRICTRSQSWFFVSEGTGFALPLLFYIPFCNHLDPNQQKRDLFSVTLQCKLMHLSVDETPCSHCRDLIRCPDCSTEVYIDSKTVKSLSKISVIIISIWQYPGVRARSAEGCCEWPATAQINECDLVDQSTPGDIRDAFERTVAISFDSIWTAEQAWRQIRKNPRWFGRLTHG